MRRATCLIIATAIASAFLVMQARAAKLETKGGICAVSLTGVIAQGDKKQLEDFLARPDLAPRMVLCLDSPGGNYTEALAVVEFLLSSDKIIATTIARGAQCYSACALIFLAGHKDKEKTVPDRRLDATATLGFHGPYIKPGAAEYDPDLVPRAYRAGVRAIGRLIALSRDALFPESLMAIGMEKGPDEFLIIQTLEQAGRWDISLVGIRPQRFPHRKAIHDACANSFVWKGMIGSSEPVAPTAFAFKNGVYRAVMEGFGDEAAWQCVADVFDAGAKGHWISIQWAARDSSELPSADTFMAEAKRAFASGDEDTAGAPAWYALNGKTRITSLAAQPPKR